MKKLYCVALDDEPLALLVISRFCERMGNIELKTFNDPQEAMTEILETKPDLVFLDIQMNNVNGLDIAHQLPIESCFIFTTAHAQYALNGFDLDAVDFLYKPFSYERFEKAVEKAKGIIKQKKDPQASIIIKHEYSNIIIRIEDIKYIEAMENYAKIYRVQGDCVLSRTSFKNILSELPSDKFMQVHRSFIIPIEKIITFTKKHIRLENSAPLIPIGRLFITRVYERLHS